MLIVVTRKIVVHITLEECYYRDGTKWKGGRLVLKSTSYRTFRRNAKSYITEGKEGKVSTSYVLHIKRKASTLRG